MRKKLLLLGGGHAHLHVLAHLSDYLETNVDVTVVTPRTFWYSGMGPGLLSGLYSRGEATIDLLELVQRGSGELLDASAQSIDPICKSVVLTDGRRLHFDVLSLNVGSEINHRLIPGYEYAVQVKPVLNLHRLHEQLEMVRPKELATVVVGGGLAGIETAANLASLLSEYKTDWSCVLLAREDRLAPGFPSRFSRLAQAELERRGITVMTNTRVIDISPESVLLNSDERLESQLTILATGVKPPEIVANSGVTVDADGAMVVSPTLQSISHPFIFGGGDCVSLMGRNLAKAGVYAVRQSPVLRHNVRAYLTGAAMQTFKPQKRFVLIANVSHSNAVGEWRGITFSGKKAFWFKQWLDKQFMARYQPRQSR